MRAFTLLKTLLSLATLLSPKSSMVNKPQVDKHKQWQMQIVGVRARTRSNCSLISSHNFLACGLSTKEPANLYPWLSRYSKISSKWSAWHNNRPFLSLASVFQTASRPSKSIITFQFKIGLRSREPFLSSHLKIKDFLPIMPRKEM